MNVVMTGAGASSRCRAPPRALPFTRDELDALLDLAEAGIGEIFALQREVLAEPPAPRRSWTPDA